MMQGQVFNGCCRPIASNAPAAAGAFGYNTVSMRDIAFLPMLMNQRRLLEDDGPANSIQATPCVKCDS